MVVVVVVVVIIIVIIPLFFKAIRLGVKHNLPPIQQVPEVSFPGCTAARL